MENGKRQKQELENLISHGPTGVTPSIYHLYVNYLTGLFLGLTGVSSHPFRSLS